MPHPLVPLVSPISALGPRTVSEYTGCRLDGSTPQLLRLHAKVRLHLLAQQ